MAFNPWNALRFGPLVSLLDGGNHSQFIFCGKATCGELLSRLSPRILFFSLYIEEPLGVVATFKYIKLL